MSVCPSNLSSLSINQYWKGEKRRKDDAAKKVLTKNIYPLDVFGREYMTTFVVHSGSPFPRVYAPRIEAHYQLFFRMRARKSSKRYVAS